MSNSRSAPRRYLRGRPGSWSRSATAAVPVVIFLARAGSGLASHPVEWVAAGSVVALLALVATFLVSFDPGAAGSATLCAVCWAIGGFPATSTPTELLTAAGQTGFWLAAALGLLRYRRRMPAQVLLVTPVVIATSGAGALSGLLWGVVAVTGSPVGWALWVTQNVLVAVVPMTVAGVAGRRRLARAVVTGILEALASPPTVEGVQAALREALRDPTATVLYRLPDTDSYVAADGLTTPGPAPGERLLVPALAEPETGQTVAVVHLDRALGADLPRVEAAVVTCGPALANARLQVLGRMRVRELRESRARVVTAAIEERRRLERNLHDGAQQILLAVSTRLVAARTRVSDPQSLEVLDAARRELRGALSDLRALTRDLFPAILASEGLAAALEVVVDEQTLQLSLAVTTERFSTDVEAIAYLTVADLLRDLQRRPTTHAAAVSISRVQGRLVILIEYQEIGYQELDAHQAGWLIGVLDRLRAVDGDLLVRPGQSGRRTVIEARIPCE